MDARGLVALPAKWMNRLLAASCALALLYLFVQIGTFGYGRDQGIYAMVARAVVSGKMPYRDAWDFKPPGIFLVYAFARLLFGSAQVGIRLVEVAGLAGMVYAMARLTELWWKDWRIGLVAGTIAVLVHAQLDFWHTAQPESFGGMATIFALLALGPNATSLEGDVKERRRRWIVGGALFGFTGLLKPPLAGGGAVVGLYLFAIALRDPLPWGPRLKRAIEPALAILAGGALPFVLCLAWFAAKGALADLRSTLFVFTPHYTALSWEGESLAGMAYWGFTEWLTTYSSVTTVGLVLLTLLRPKKEEAPGVILLGGIIVIQIIGVVMQGKFFPYHYGATWPPTALLAGLGFIRLWQRLERWGLVGFGLFVAAAWASLLCKTATKDTPDSFRARCDKRITLLLGGMSDTLTRDKLASVADVNAIANRAVAAYVKERVPAEKTIFVFGFEPVIYDLADRTPSSRFLYDVPQRVDWAKQPMRDTMMWDLSQHPPAAIIVEHRDVFPVVTGNTIDSADTVREFWAFSELLRTRYRLSTTIEDFDIYFVDEKD